MRLTPATELEYRCQKLQDLMIENRLNAVIMAQNADLYYFTGTIQSGCLYVPAAGQPLYLVRRDFNRARMESGLKELVFFGSPRIFRKFWPATVILRRNGSALSLMYCRSTFWNATARYGHRPDFPTPPPLSAR